MGMMSDGNVAPQEVPQPAPAEQGMMGGQPPQQASNPTLSHGQFNGTVQFDDNRVNVSNGVADVFGKKYLVSDNGAMIISVDGQLLGRVQDGVAIPIDEQYTTQMRNAGYIE